LVLFFKKEHFFLRLGGHGARCSSGCLVPLILVMDELHDRVDAAAHVAALPRQSKIVFGAGLGLGTARQRGAAAWSMK
jgi:hypothetical protein